MNKYILLAVLILLLVYMLVIAPSLNSAESTEESRAENFTAMNLSGFDPTNPSIGFNHPMNERSVKHGSSDTINNTVQMNSSHQPVGLLDRDPYTLRFRDETGRPNIRDYNMSARRYDTKAPQKAVNMSEPTVSEQLMADQKADCKAVNNEKCGLTQPKPNAMPSAATQSSANVTQPNLNGAQPTANVTQQNPNGQSKIETMSQNNCGSNCGPDNLRPAAKIPPKITPTLQPTERSAPAPKCDHCERSTAPEYDIATRYPPARPETILRYNKPMHDEYHRQLLKSGNVESPIHNPDSNPDMKRVDFVEFYNNISDISNSYLKSTKTAMPSNIFSDVSSDNSDMSSDMSSDVSSDDESCEIASKCSADSCGSESLHPILDPRFNMREVAKQALLLEDHINNTKKRCFDCIRKHFLIVDGLLEEAVSLEKDLKQRALYRALYMNWITLEKQYASNPLNSDNLDNVSQQVRLFRKPLVEQYFDLVKDYDLTN